MRSGLQPEYLRLQSDEIAREKSNKRKSIDSYCTKSILIGAEQKYAWLVMLTECLYVMKYACLV